MLFVPNSRYTLCERMAIYEDKCDRLSVVSNGNDAMCLVEKSTGALVDCVGDFATGLASTVPGWNVCGMKEATKDSTLVRKHTIKKGNAGGWAASAGTNTGNCEWVVHRDASSGDAHFGCFGEHCRPRMPIPCSLFRSSSLGC